MKIISTDFSGLCLIEHNACYDLRGSFMEIFRKESLEKSLGYEINFCQQNSVLSYKNTLRGLHFQKEPYSQSKLISVNFGEIIDVVVDVRNDSPTYGQYLMFKLSSNDNKSIFIPKGLAHGYLVISEKSLVTYSVDNYYNQKSQTGVRFNDKYLNIDWGLNPDDLIISEKDRNLKEFDW